MHAKRRAGWLAKKKAEIINQACRMVFSVGFKRCKRIVQMQLPTDSVGSHQVDVVDESLIAIAADRAEKFVRASRHSIEANNINVAIQTEEVTDAKGGHSETSRLGGASKR